MTRLRCRRFNSSELQRRGSPVANARCAVVLGRPGNCERRWQDVRFGRRRGDDGPGGNLIGEKTRHDLIAANKWCRRNELTYDPHKIKYPARDRRSNHIHGIVDTDLRTAGRIIQSIVCICPIPRSTNGDGVQSDETALELFNSANAIVGNLGRSHDKWLDDVSRARNRVKRRIHDLRQSVERLDETRHDDLITKSDHRRKR